MQKEETGFGGLGGAEREEPCVRNRGLKSWPRFCQEIVSPREKKNSKKSKKTFTVVNDRSKKRGWSSGGAREGSTY